MNFRLFLIALSVLATVEALLPYSISRISRSQVSDTSFSDTRRSQTCRRTSLASSIIGDNDNDEGQINSKKDDEEELILRESSDNSSTVQKWIDGLPFVHLFKSEGYKKLPPMQVEDMNLLLYDVFLIVNLTLSISFWVTHRMSFEYIPAAFNEGSLLSILWIGSGLYHGSFLSSAMDGHYRSTDEESGPKAAAVLAFNTFLNAVNLRLIFALITAVVHHRQVGIDPGEQLLPLEIGFGLLLMTGWRTLHSSITPRI
jgi:hypothetical protein